VDSTLSGTLISRPLADLQDHNSTRKYPDRSFDRWAAFAALCAIWWIAIDHLRVEWSINEQYSYGWFVPVAGALPLCEAVDQPPPP
jgi:hypothetical protein